MENCENCEECTNTDCKYWKDFHDDWQNNTTYN